MTAYWVSLQHSSEERKPSAAFYAALDTLAFRSQEQADKIHKIMSYDFSNSEKKSYLCTKIHNL